MLKQRIKEAVDSRLRTIEDKLDVIERQNSELLWASYFRDSIASSGWVIDKSFSAVNGAASYSFLYKLFKIYDIVKPEVIVEFGLGQSTNLTRQYCSSNKKAKAIVYDHDATWVETYKSYISGVDNVKLKFLATEDFMLKNGTVGAKDTQYARLRESLKSEKIKEGAINLVIVDGPIGVDKDYSRTDILNIVDLLSETFVVLIDDSNRKGEQHTIEFLRKELEARKVQYSDWTVNGMKQQTIFASLDIADILWAV